MSWKIVLRGHMRWIFPLIIIVLTIAVMNNCWNPMKEHFDDLESSESSGKSSKDPTNEDSTDEQEDIEEVENVDTEEGFETFDNTAEVLRKGWRHKNMPQPLEAYYGPIRGYNCGEYSEFSLGAVVPPCLNTGKCNSEWIEPPKCESDYIFPGKIAYKGEVPLTPYFLNHEEDVVNKRIDADRAEEAYKANKLDPRDADYIARPNYMYHRGDKNWNSILDPKKRYEPKYSY